MKIAELKQLVENKQATENEVVMWLSHKHRKMITELGLRVYELQAEYLTGVEKDVSSTVILWYKNKLNYEAEKKK